MKSLWQQRLTQHLKEQAKFLKLVFNEYFIIAIIFMIGAFGYWYSQALTHLTLNVWWVKPLGIIILTVCGLLFKVATLMQSADTTFLLPKEVALRGYLIKARNYSWWLPCLTLILVNFFLTPFWAKGAGLKPTAVVLIALATLILEIGAINNRLASNYVEQPAKLWWESCISFVLVLLVALYWLPLVGVILAVILTALSFYQLHQLLNQKPLQWTYLVQQEQQRSYQLKRFYNLFTDVPGMKGKSRRYRLLDGLYRPIKLQQSQSGLYLFSRGFVRNTDYSGLFLRLTIVDLILIACLKNVWLISIMSSLFLYLVEFQLVPLYKSYDTNVLFQIYPLSTHQKQRNFQTLLSVILMSQWLLELVVLIIVYHLQQVTLIAGLVGLIMVIFLLKVYLPHQLKNLER